MEKSEGKMGEHTKEKPEEVKMLGRMEEKQLPWDKMGGQTKEKVEEVSMTGRMEERQLPREKTVDRKGETANVRMEEGIGANREEQKNMFAPAPFLPPAAGGARVLVGDGESVVGPCGDDKTCSVRTFACASVCEYERESARERKGCMFMCECVCVCVFVCVCV